MPSARHRPSAEGALRAPELVAAVGQAADVLADHAAALDALPSPAGGAGSGTEAAAVVGAAATAAAGARDFASVGAALAAGAAAAASTPAGRALAAWFDGVAEVLRATDVLDGERLAVALELGAESLAAAGLGPGPGGVAPVAAAAATGALAVADDGGPLAAALIAAADAGLAELERGPVDDEALGDGVDAVAAGLLLVLDVLASIVTGEPLPRPPGGSTAAGAAADVDAVGEVDRYEVTGAVLPEVDCGPEEAFHLRSVLVELADEVVLDDAPGPDGAPAPRWPFRAVSARPGAVVEAVCEVGRPVELSIRLVHPG